MSKKILKYMGWTVGSLLGLIILVLLLLYLPPVQNFVKSQALSYVNNNLGLGLSVEKLRIKFPLKLSLEHALMITPEGDTLINASRLEAGISIIPLLRQQVRAGSLSLDNTYINFKDSVESVRMRAMINTVGISDIDFKWKKNELSLGKISISDGTAALWLDASRKTVLPQADTVQSIWKIRSEGVELQNIEMRMLSVPDTMDIQASVTGIVVTSIDMDIDRQTIRADECIVSNSDVALFIMPVVNDRPTAPQDNVKDSSLPWTINVGKVVLENDNLLYSTVRSPSTPTLDLSYIKADSLSLNADSVYNRGAEVSLHLRELYLRERSGLVIEQASGGFRMDSVSFIVDNFSLRTGHSTVKADVYMEGPVDQLDDNVPLRGNIDASIASRDIFHIIPPDRTLQSVLAGGNLQVDGRFSGTLSDLLLQTVDLNIPGMAHLTASGTIRSLTEPSSLGGNLTFNGIFNDLNPLLGLVPDSSLRNRIGLPHSMTINGRLAFSGNYYAPDITLTADSGLLDLRGNINLSSEVYDIFLAASDFPAGEFLPQDSLGMITMELHAVGNGFDPFDNGTSTDIEMSVDRLDYRNYDYRDIDLSAILKDRLFDTRIQSGSEALDFELRANGALARNNYSADVTGDFNMIDLYRLNLSDTPLAASFNLDATGSANITDSIYYAELTLDSVFVSHGGHTDRLSDTHLTASATMDSVTVYGDSGDLTLRFAAPASLGSLIGGIQLSAAEINRQVDARDINMDSLRIVLPPLELRLSAGRDNVLNTLLRERGMSFKNLDVRATSNEQRPLSAWVVIDGYQTTSLTLDTLNIGVMARDEKLRLFARLANKPGNIDQMALITVRGEAVDNTAQLNFFQRDRQDSVGFRFGLNAQLLDSAVTVRIFPENPVFGYERWTVNSDNYLTYGFNNEISADIRLDAPDQHFYVRSDIGTGMTGGTIVLDMEGIDIGNTMRLFPSPIPIDGRLGSDITVSMNGRQMVGDGTVNVDSLQYRNNLVGNLGLTFGIDYDTTAIRLRDARLSSNGTQVLTAQGTYGTGPQGRVDAQANLTSLPLNLADAFIPDNTVVLQGELSSNLSVTGPTSSPVIDGELAFTGARATVVPIGTPFTLPSDAIRIDRNRVDFDNYAVRSRDNKTLTIDGIVDISSVSRPNTDLDIYATDFDVINSTRGGGSMVYGKGYLDIDITAKGYTDALSVRGDITVLNSTDVTYTITQGPLKVEDRKQDLVTFVSFSDTTSLFLPDSVIRRNTGVDMLVNIDIDDGVEFTVNLSEDGNNRAELIGDGNLTYTLNTLGDSRFTGRYNLSGGTVVYSPPIIQAVNFSVRDNSYVEWTGELADPTFNITADQTKRTIVTMEDNTQSTVNFDVIVNIQNTLEDLDLSFDLTTNDDLSIQNQLLSLAPEQRSTQALALLIYNTYTGPGTTAKVDTNNPLNTFIEKELNQWARNNLNDIDVSFGINQYDDPNSNSQHTDYSYRVSKSLFDDRVKVTVGGSLNSDESTQDNLKENFVDDISIEYRLNRRDNMFLKAYRYNTQESVLEGEVTETGVGFVARKKLNRLAHLFRFSRSPEKKQARADKKEIKRRFRDAEEESGSDPAKKQRQNDSIILNDDDEQEKKNG